MKMTYPKNHKNSAKNNLKIAKSVKSVKSTKTVMIVDQANQIGGDVMMRRHVHTL